MKKLLALLAGVALAGPLAPAAADGAAHHPDVHGDPLAPPAPQPETRVIVPSDPHARTAPSSEPGPTHVVVEPGAPPTTVTVEPGDDATTVTVEPGAEERAAFGAPGQPTTRSPDQLRDQQRLARESRAPFRTSLLLAPRGLADVDRLDRLDRSGERAGTLGLELDRVVGGPLSLVVGGEVGQRDRGPGVDDVTTLGLFGGVNLFLLGGHNEGLYVGPRVGFLAAGVDDAVDSVEDRLGYGGELGLRAIVGPGFTAGLAAGVMNQTRGTVNLDRDVAVGRGGLGERDNFAYGTVQAGWSW